MGRHICQSDGVSGNKYSISAYEYGLVTYDWGGSMQVYKPYIMEVCLGVVG